jgi:hypothetical protein
MARQITERWVDDLDGSDGASTVEFSVDRRSYTVDLSETNKKRLLEALAPFIDVAKVTSSTGSRGRAARGHGDLSDLPTRRSNREELQRIREWARANGHQVSDRGRISGEIQAAYRAAN